MWIALDKPSIKLIITDWQQEWNGHKPVQPATYQFSTHSSEVLME